MSHPHLQLHRLPTDHLAEKEQEKGLKKRQKIKCPESRHHCSGGLIERYRLWRRSCSPRAATWSRPSTSCAGSESTSRTPRRPSPPACESGILSRSAARESRCSMCWGHSRLAPSRSSAGRACSFRGMQPPIIPILHEGESRKQPDNPRPETEAYTLHIAKLRTSNSSYCCPILVVSGAMRLLSLNLCSRTTYTPNHYETVTDMVEQSPKTSQLPPPSPSSTSAPAQAASRVRQLYLFMPLLAVSAPELFLPSPSPQIAN